MKFSYFREISQKFRIEQHWVRSLA